MSAHRKIKLVRAEKPYDNVKTCECYHEHKDWIGKGECFGTKEREMCSCDGDMRRCDFYPEVREKGWHELSNECKVRTATIYELAALLACECPPGRKECKPYVDKEDTDCYRCWLDWLKKDNWRKVE